MKKLISVALSLILALSCCFCAAYAAEGAQPFRVSVTVNGDTSTSRGICWYTAGDTGTVAEIYEDGVKSETCSAEYDSGEWKGNYYHKALITGLEPGKTYTYRVGNGSVWSEGAFTTDDGDGSFGFIAVSDIQASNADNFRKSAATLAAAVETMPDAELVVNCGDFTDDCTNEQWDWYFETTAESMNGLTLAPVAGNHDGLVKDGAGWFSHIFDLDESRTVGDPFGVNYSFDYGNAHFAVLDTNDCIVVSDAQLEWLKNDLDSTAKDWKIVLMHKSLYTLGKDGKWPDVYYIRSQVVKIFDKCDVDLVISGHDHMYLRTKQLTGGSPAEGGTSFVLAGTAGAKRYEIRSFLADSFLDTGNIASLHIQKNGYGNYWNGSDWNSTDESNIGGCFSTVAVDGGTLTLNAYILGDESGEITNIDTLTLRKNTGENKATYTGDNTTSSFKYAASAAATLGKLLGYALFVWLPKFFRILPKIVSVYKNEGTF